jgi:hypothetical protein
MLSPPPPSTPKGVSKFALMHESLPYIVHIFAHNTQRKTTWLTGIFIFLFLSNCLQAIEAVCLFLLYESALHAMQLNLIHSDTLYTVIMC